MKKKLNLIFCISLFLLTSCNNDIFTDESSLPNESSVTIEGDGGLAKFSIPVSDLREIVLSPTFSESSVGNLITSTIYYSADGQKIDQASPVSEISRIVYDDGISGIELVKSGKIITVSSICNAYPKEINYCLQLIYASGIKNINILSLPGQPLQLISAEARQLMENEDAEKKISKLSFSNQGNENAWLMFYPMQDEAGTIFIDPHENSWLEGMPISAMFPVIYWDKWIFRKESGVIPGSEYRYWAGISDMCLQANIPAKTDGYMEVVASYRKAEASYSFTFKNQILDRTLKADCMVYCSYPVNFNMYMHTSDGNVADLSPYR